jgi:hypothetical protein
VGGVKEGEERKKDGEICGENGRQEEKETGGKN